MTGAAGGSASHTLSQSIQQLCQAGTKLVLELNALVRLAREKLEAEEKERKADG